MAYDNRRYERSLWPAQDYFTRVLPRALLSSLVRPVEEADPEAQEAAPPLAATVMGYTKARKAGARDHEAWLKIQRRRYRYRSPADNPIAPIALAERVPLTANYSLGWALPYMPVLLPVLAHVAANRARFNWQRLRGKFDRFASYRQVFSGVLSKRGDIPFPAPTEDYCEDAAFARQRLDGPNPLLIARVPDRAWIAARMEHYTDEAFAATTGHCLLTELAAGNVYTCDYVLLQESLKPAAHRDSRWRDTYLPAPIVLFWYHPGALAESDLVPIAIQLDRSAGTVWHQADAGRPAVARPVPIFTPADGDAWALAKSLTQAADQNHQVNSTHIGRTHWLLEPFALAVPRQLPPDHPLYLLLEPHLRFTLAVNDTTIPLITQRGRIFATIYAGTLEETRQIMIRTHEAWGFRDLGLAADLQARGMDSYPGHYPYREDARRLFRATHEFVDAYVRHYYETDAQVAEDSYLQAFIAELGDPARGNLRGLLAGAALDTVAELVEIFAQVLFTCGPQHAAVHYPQLEYYSYIPASAGAAHRPPPMSVDEVRSDSLLASLPPLHNTLVQFQTDNIGNYRYDRYGDYAKYRLGRPDDPAVARLLGRFQAALMTVQREIEADNSERGPRVQPYVFMLPSNIPNSVNI